MNILFVHNHLSSFVEIDLKILQREYNTQEVHFQHKSLRLLLISCYEIFRGVIRNDIVLCWFGGFHSFVSFLLAKLFRRRCIVIASGYDVANVPKIAYGNMRPGLKRIMGNLVFGMADSVLAVSNFTSSELTANTWVSPSKVKVIPHGLRNITNTSGIRKTDKIITIGRINRNSIKLKGLDVFVQAAHYLPEVEFILIGASEGNGIEYLRSIAPSNLVFPGYIKDVYNSDLLASAKVYAQLSLYESFGCGLAESMLQGCVPVVTNCGALPEVVGEVGFYVPYGDVESTVAAMQEALRSSEERSELARWRIIETFPLEKRRQLLLQSIRDVYFQS